MRKEKGGSGMNGLSFCLKNKALCDKMIPDGNRRIQPADGFVQYDLIVGRHEPKAAMMETFDAHVNRNTKDSIFCDLFSRPEYCLQLYKVLHPEDTDVRKEEHCPDDAFQPDDAQPVQ